MRSEGYSSYFVCVCVCVSVCLSVCLSVTIIAVASFISTLKLRYKRLYYGIILVFSSWILIKMEVMASFAYR